MTMPEPEEPRADDGASVATNGGPRAEEEPQDDKNALEKQSNDDDADPPAVPLSKNAQKRLARQQRWEAKKAEKKALAREQRQKEAERKRKEWEESLAAIATEEERVKLIESRKSLRKERMEKRSQEKDEKKERLCKARECGQNVVVDLDFAHLMNPNEIHSLVQQVMYCYAMNGRCASPAHLLLTGCGGEMENELKKIPGFDKWMIEKEDKSYIEALQDRKEDLVYLTADSDTILEELDLKKIYIIGGLVDRNRWKGETMKKAQEQGIQTAKLPIGNFMKMSSSQSLSLLISNKRQECRHLLTVLTVNQVFEILLKFLETKDWKTSFFAVIPQRKRCQTDTEGNADADAEVTVEEENGQKDDQMASKKKCVEDPCNN